ncbi:MAG TPA: NUDIX hydrolase, partial [Ktedonobacteraceae bacterium]|nr:NUDIX hydrolase [Ktedonobacteraceae bacterium]
AANAIQCETRLRTSLRVPPGGQTRKECPCSPDETAVSGFLIETIRREVREEVGYQVGDLQPIATFYVSPGGSSERVALYYAEVGEADRVAAGGGCAAEHEDIEQVELSLPELWTALHEGNIVDAKTLIAV